MKYIFILLISFSAISLACSDVEEHKGSSSSEMSQTEEYVISNSSEMDDSTVIAMIGNDSVTINQVLTSLSIYDPTRRELFLTKPLQVQNYLNSYITSELLYRQAIKDGLGNRPEIQKKLHAFRKELFVRTLGQEIIPALVSPEQVKQYIDDNAESLTEVRLSHIFFRADPPTGAGKEKAKEKAEAAHARLLAGESFEALVDELTDDPRSKRNKGDIGYINKAKYPEDISKKIFAMKSGEISEPLELLRGYSIVKIAEPAHVPPTERIKSKVEIAARKQIFQAYVDGLRTDMQVKVLDDKIEEITGNE